MNEINRDEALGIVKISDEVISVIASIAASEIDGVVDINQNGLTQKITGKKNMTKGVKVSVEKEVAAIDLSIAVQYGVKIPEVVSQVQENVKKTVEAITGLNVQHVNVCVHNIIILKKKDKNEISEK